MVDRALGRTRTVNTFGSVGEVVAWLVDSLLDVGVARTFDLYARRGNPLALDRPINISMMDDCEL